MGRGVLSQTKEASLKSQCLCSLGERKDGVTPCVESEQKSQR